jgi:methionine-rich copper-binding protein CopC
MRMLPGIIALCSLTLFGWPSCMAWGHAFPHHSEPKVVATLTVVPSRIRIWFDGALEPAFSSIRVQDANGQRVDTGDGHVDPADATLLEVDLTPLAPGRYRVIWSVVARDGHRTEGDFMFTIQRGD